MRSIARSGVCPQRWPHAQQQLARDLEMERAVMGQRCRPQSFGEVQRCNTLYLLWNAALLLVGRRTWYCCSWSSMWSSLTDQLVRKFKDSVGINITMKKFFIFVPVPIKKKLFERSEFLFRTRTAVQASCEKHSTEWSLPAATAARTAATCTWSRGGARCHGAALSASKFRRGAARQSAAKSMAGFQLNSSSAAVETKAESEPATSLSGNL